VSTDNSESMMKLDPNDLESLNGGITIGNRDRNACPYCGTKALETRYEKDLKYIYCTQCGKQLQVIPVGVKNP